MATVLSDINKPTAILTKEDLNLREEAAKSWENSPHLPLELRAYITGYCDGSRRVAKILKELLPHARMNYHEHNAAERERKSVIKEAEKFLNESIGQH